MCGKATVYYFSMSFRVLLINYIYNIGPNDKTRFTDVVIDKFIKHHWWLYIAIQKESNN